ncbi:MAG: thioredoxin TrxC [Gemmatimonadota bacterium]
MHATLRCPFCLTLNRIDVSRADDRPKCGDCGRPILLDRPVKVVDEDFDRLIDDAEVPVLVDFHADWCGPCKAMAPALDDLAHERSGDLLVAKLDTDANPKTSERFEIRAIPTLIVFRGGQEAGRVSGAVPAADLAALVDGSAPSADGENDREKDGENDGENNERQ